MQDSASPRRLQIAARVARYGTCLLFLTIFVATHIPPPRATGVAVSDKTLHVVAYMALTISVLVSWELSTGILRPTHYFMVWLFGTLYGAFDEITQIPVGRSCDGMDWLSDVVGIVLGLTFFRVLRPLLYRWF